MYRLTCALSLLVTLATVGSCASDATRRSEQDMIVVDKKSDRQVMVEFDGACAMSVLNGEYRLGDQRFMLQHEGKTYYFADEQAKQKFERNLNENIEKSNQRWAAAMEGVHGY